MSESIREFTPREIVSELDRYIIGQNDAKRAVAIAMRNRWRRQQISDPELREEISPKNIIMIGATGVGKTEIARRLAKLANAPFIKVEASKFTEVGYVGKDVESMIRELMEISINLVQAEEESKYKVKAEELAEERLLDILLPKPKAQKKNDPSSMMGFETLFSEDDDEAGNTPDASEKIQPKQEEVSKETHSQTREKMRSMLRKGQLENRIIELESNPVGGANFPPMVEVVTTGAGIEDIGKNIRDMFSNLMNKGPKRKKVTVNEALKMLAEEEAAKLVEQDEVIKKAIEKVEQSGIVFIDEIDKIAAQEKGGGRGPDVSREGVQRDILPIVEGCRVSTKYGPVHTDHILFISAGAFHMAKPSDLIPELQGRFPIRVELNKLTEDDFYRILTEPKHSLTKQYTSLLDTEKVKLNFSTSGLREIARFATLLNDEMENIGARRLHTILENVVDDISFKAPEKSGEEFIIDEDYVKSCLSKIAQDQDLSRYIL